MLDMPRKLWAAEVRNTAAGPGAEDRDAFARRHVSRAAPRRREGHAAAARARRGGSGSCRAAPGGLEPRSPEARVGRSDFWKIAGWVTGPRRDAVVFALNCFEWSAGSGSTPVFSAHLV